MVQDSNNNIEGFERLLKNIHLDSFLKFLCFIPSSLWLEDLEFGHFGLHSHFSDINAKSCDYIHLLLFGVQLVEKLS